MQISRVILGLISLPLFAQVDPSIFDGSNASNLVSELPSSTSNTTGEAPEEAASPSPPGGGKETAAELGELPEGPLVKPEVPGSGETGVEPQATPTGAGAPAATAPAAAATEAQGETVSPIPPANPGRAGESVQSTEKIPADQAVDFPWDI